MYITIKFLATNYSSNSINKEVTMDLFYLGGGNFETSVGTTIHIFDQLPFMRRINSNKGWFEQNLYHFKQI